MFMNAVTIEITEPEELFLLNAICQSLWSLNTDFPLFLVGEWIRSKFFQKDFLSLRNGLLPK